MGTLTRQCKLQSRGSAFAKRYNWCSGGRGINAIPEPSIVYTPGSLAERKSIGPLGSWRSRKRPDRQIPGRDWLPTQLPCSSAWKFLYSHPTPRCAVVAIVGAFFGGPAVLTPIAPLTPVILLCRTASFSVTAVRYNDRFSDVTATGAA